MIDVMGWNWVVDTDEMTCKNVENEVTIKIEKSGDNFRGMIRDMPMGLFSEIAKRRDGERIIENIVKTAEEEYLKAGTKNDSLLPNNYSPSCLRERY